MLENFIRNATHIYFACGATDFRKQTESLASLVSAQFKLDPYLQDCVFVFCNTLIRETHSQNLWCIPYKD